MMPYHASRWRQVFQASVATRSPSCTPSRSRRCATLRRPGADFRIGGGVERPFDRAGDDLALAVVDGGMVDDAMAEQRPVLHQPEHGVFLPGLRALGLGVTCVGPRSGRRRNATGPARRRNRVRHYQMVRAKMRTGCSGGAETDAGRGVPRPILRWRASYLPAGWALLAGLTLERRQLGLAAQGHDRDLPGPVVGQDHLHLAVALLDRHVAHLAAPRRQVEDRPFGGAGAASRHLVGHPEVGPGIVVAVDHHG